MIFQIFQWSSSKKNTQRALKKVMLEDATWKGGLKTSPVMYNFSTDFTKCTKFCVQVILIRVFSWQSLST